MEVKEQPLPIVEDTEAIKSLQFHPGFIALSNRFKKQAAFLETELKRKSHKDLRSVDQLQLGIEWLEYMQKQVDEAVSKKTETMTVVASTTDIEQFQKVLAHIQGV